MQAAASASRAPPVDFLQQHLRHAQSVPPEPFRAAVAKQRAKTVPVAVIRDPLDRLSVNTASLVK